MPSSPLRRLLGGMTVIGATLLGACGGGSDSPTGPGPGPRPRSAARSRTRDPGPGALWPHLREQPGAVRQRQSRHAGALRRDHRHDGRRLDGGHRLPSIRRPLYGVGTDSRVYTIDTLTGAASAVAGAFTPGVSGEHFGLAFSGAQDRLRLSSVEGNQNLSIDPLTGTVASADPDLAFAAGDANAGATPRSRPSPTARPAAARRSTPSMRPRTRW